MINSLFRKKLTDLRPEESRGLEKVLNGFDLTLLGVGAIIGAGIFVITGIAAATQAGPAIILSYIIAGLACGFTALSYAELAASVGGCGSAYGYAYAAMGELIAWIIGWDLVLEYSFSVATVSVGWSHYVHNLLTSLHISIPTRLLTNPFEGGYLNLPALLIIFVLMMLLIYGVKTSARANTIMVAIKLSVIALFIVIAYRHFHIENWSNFMPFGWSGVMSGAALIFFAYIGFDAVSTAAEETIEPQRNLPIGIISSLFFCSLLYILVSGLLTGAIFYPQLNVSSPISHALLILGHPIIAALVAVGAVSGLTTVMLVMYYGLSRVILAMARDGLLPASFAHISSKTHTPIRAILIPGIFIMALGAFFSINELAELVNIGTLAAFVIVCAGVIILRYTQPEMPRPFRVPFAPWTPLLGMLFSIALMFSLPIDAFIRFALWMLVGLIIYFGYSRFRSKAASV